MERIRYEKKQAVPDEDGGLMSMPHFPSFVVVGRAPASLKLRQDESLIVSASIETLGTVDIRFRTRYQPVADFSKPIPTDIWAEVRGRAPDLTTALPSFLNAALSMTPFISLAANAHIGMLECELAYDDTEGKTERPYFQAFVPERPIVPYSRRFIEVGATAALITAFSPTGKGVAPFALPTSTISP